MNDFSRRPKVAIIGGGAGGIELAIRLARSKKAHVTLVDKAPAHFWKPRLHEVAAGLIDPAADEVGYLALGQKHGFRFHYGSLESLEVSTLTVTVAAVTPRAGAEEILRPRTFNCDALVLAFGSRVDDFGIEGVNSYCHMLDSSAQAEAFNREFLDAALQIYEGQRPCLKVGIVGAGATGVELAAELYHAAHDMKLYGGLGTEGHLDITIVDMANRVLPGADLKASAYAASKLKTLGVKIVLSEAVARVTAEGFHLKDGSVIPCDLKVWASGITGLPLSRTISGLQLARQDKLITDAYLSCVGVENIYAIGDCAAVPDGHGGNALPATAQVAHQQAAYLAKALPSKWQGKPTRPFVYNPRGSLISLGRSDATAEFPSFFGADTAIVTRGILPKMLYGSLQYLHRVVLYGWVRASALGVADWLRRITIPPVKLH